MFSLRQPTDEDAKRLIEGQRTLPFTYPPGPAPKGFLEAHRRDRLGTGPEAFERAKAAVRAWTMFRMPWVRLFGSEAPLEPGTTVAMAAHTLGFWTLNACRVVRTVEDPDRFGFAYGTLPHHVERGEERFLVEREPDGSVWYDLSSFSRPGHPLVRLGEPLARHLQRRFVEDSVAAMKAAV